MNSDETFYDDDSRPVPSVPFDYDALDGQPEPMPDDRQAEAMDILRRGLLVALDGHRDATRTRVFALATLAELFPSPTVAARVAGVAPSTIYRAVQSLRRELAGSLRTKKDAENASETAPMATPR